MQNKKLIVLIVLVIGALFSLIYGSSKGKRKTPSGQAAIQHGERARPTKKGVPALRHAIKTDFVTWARNPFVLKTIPVVAPAPVAQPAPLPSSAKLALDGIMWDEKNPKAMVNGRLMGIGDKIGEYEVIDIKKNKVTLNNGVEDIVLRLSY
ncbi:MAG: hypothetical protein JSV93_04510 [Candidatus Omnitrophota bacterium]|nr:MAG: hypothetical protein JSV93_04510 [Candidatus Omnitrophota bacterium]